MTTNASERAIYLFGAISAPSFCIVTRALTPKRDGYMCFARCWLADGWRFMARRKGKRAETFFAPLPGRAADTLPLWTLAFSSSF